MDLMTLHITSSTCATLADKKYCTLQVVMAGSAEGRRVQGLDCRPLDNDFLIFFTERTPVYISEDAGSDESGLGSIEAPYKTLLQVTGHAVLRV